MSSLALMRLLESAPLRYDAGMRAITLGRISELHAAVAAALPAGAAVVEIGCGTGAVTRRLVERGARVTALDQNPEMLELARRRLAGAPPEAVRWLERTAAEIDALPEEGFDAVVASLCLSEMSAGERRHVLREAFRRLRPGGLLVLGDEVRSRRWWQRAIQLVTRAPQALLAWILAGSVSRPIPDPEAEVRAAGFEMRRAEHWLFGSLACLVARRPI